MSGAVETLEDITDRKKAEEELRDSYEQIAASEEELRHQFDELKKSEDARRESEERYRDLIETTSDWIWEVDKNGVYTYASPKIRDILGYEPDEVIGKTPFDLMPPGESENVAGIFSSYIIPQKPFTGLENINLHKDGLHVVLETSGVPFFDGRHTLLGYRGIDRDITDRKRTEEAFHQSNKKLNLLSSITRHDILNQLMALKGYLSLSNEMIDKPAILAGYIQKEQIAANAIERQITFTRDYQELGVAAPEWQNVNASIKKAVAGLPMRSIHVEVDPKNPEIFADRLFENVFYNLIDNALRYGSDQMNTIRVSSQEIDSGLRIVCEDDGVGITEEDKKRLFTRGFGKNTGLGLFLSGRSSRSPASRLLRTVYRVKEHGSRSRCPKRRTGSPMCSDILINYRLTPDFPPLYLSPVNSLPRSLHRDRSGRREQARLSARTGSCGSAGIRDIGFSVRLCT